MQLLGGLDAERFLSQFWQTKPLLVRNAIPDFKGVVQAPELLALATRDDIESRLVWRRRGAWRLRHGPFSRSDLARLPTRNWTLLVQGLNLQLPAADALLRRFRFLPYSRLDDVMVSYAAPGGGVGPHFDSYDVFLLQGQGRRSWGVGRPRGRKLDPAAPLQILRNFRPEMRWLLDPGDMLYLPPGWAHDGVALDSCFTYSIGLRSPSHRETAREFLGFLQDRVEFDGHDTDRGIKPARHPAEIPEKALRQAAAVARRIRWNRRDIETFLGEYLSAPKPHVAFLRPRPPRSVPRFKSLCRTRGLRLDLRTRMLFRVTAFFVNGERVEPAKGLRSWLVRLADERVLPAGRRMPAALLSLLHRWYAAGWLHIGDRDE
jgi:50S ribosomal protein L16 3-hydroxylase